MALEQLTPEQVRTWSRAEKDSYWLTRVFRGDAPQLTLRSAVTGMLLGAVLSLTNLYIGAKTGWTLGVGLTSVLLAFAVFKLLKRLGIGAEFGVLENNAMQSIATAAGYMTMPLTSSMAAYMMVTGSVLPMWIMMVWLVLLSLLGVLYAFPLKRRFINDEQLPFPEGRAAGVVMDALHGSDGAEGLRQAKVLSLGAIASCGVKFLQSEKILRRLGMGFLAVPEYLDGWIYRWASPSIAGVSLRELTIRPDTDLVIMAAGGLMGIRTGASLFLGALINYALLAPWMISRGDIEGKLASGNLHFGFRAITMWALWGGVALMTTSSLVSFFSRPGGVLRALRSLFSRGSREARLADGAKSDVLRHIELPLSWSWVGIPALGACAVAFGHLYFGVDVLLGILALPLVFVFTIIAVHATALTSITPGSAIGKLTQLCFGGLAPGNVTTNLITAGITAEVAMNASNLLMDIKPGYMLGAKPRQQALGHVLGIFAGCAACVPVFYAVFLRHGVEGLSSEEHPMPAATVWRAVAEVLTKGLSNIPVSARYAAGVGICLGILLEVAKSLKKRELLVSGVALGLATVIPFNTCLSIFLGSLVFWLGGRIGAAAGRAPGGVRDQEPLCAGVIAGGSITGILLMLVENLLL